MIASYQQYIKSELLPCLGAPDRHLRSTVGTVVSVIVQQVQVRGWPELMQALVQCFDNNDFNHMEGALDALSKVTQGLTFGSPSVVIYSQSIFFVYLNRFYVFHKNSKLYV